MYAIKPKTRERWTNTLEEEYQIEASNAETIVDLIVGDPRVSLSRPQTKEELEATVDSVRTVIDEMDLTEFGDIDDHDKLRDTLVGMLRTDLGLTGADGPVSNSKTAVANQKPEERSATGAANDRVSDSETAHDSDALGEPSGDEPPAKLAPYIDQLVEKIDDEDSEFNEDDVREIARWVVYKSQDRSAD
jgi:hypothetical protein